MNEDRPNQSPPASAPLFDEKSLEQLQKAVVQIGAAIMFFFFAAATTATDPFFRKNMGERYLSLVRIVISATGWSVMVYLSYAFLMGTTRKTPWFTLITGIIIVVAYLVFSGIQYCVVIRKRHSGAYWHSKSRGESIFGSENAGRDALIELAATVALFFASPLYSVFFFISRALGYISDAAARKMLYNKYLDIQDAKIEAQFMEVALREGLAPGLTAGFCARLPLGVKSEHRANVAKVVSNGMREIRGFRSPDAAEDPKPQTMPSPPPEPPATIFIKALNESWKRVLDFCSTLKRYKRFGIRILAGGVIILAVLYAYRWHKKHPWEHSVAISSSRPASVAQPVFPQAAISNAVQSQDPTPPPAATIVPMANISPQPEPPKPDPAAIRAALEAKRQKQREEAFRQITNILAAQAPIFLKFKQDCFARLNDNTNRIEKVGFTHRRPLRRENESARDLFQTAIQKHENLFNQGPQNLQSVFDNPHSDLSQTSNDLASTVSAMEKDRQQVVDALDKLDNDINNAPPPWRVFR